MKIQAKNRKKIIIAIVIVIIALIAAYLLFWRGNGEEIKSIAVERGNVVSEVSVTGRVTPAKSINLAFESGGRINSIAVSVGKVVSAGQLIASLENDDLAAQIAQAKANVKMQEAKLSDLRAGTRPEEIQIKEAELKKAEQDLENYYSGIVDVLNDAYAKADDAVRTKTDELFLNDDTQTPKLTFQISYSQIEVDVVALRVRATSELNIWKSELGNLSNISPNSEKLEKSKKGKEHLSVIREYLAKALDAMDASVGISVSTVSSYKANIYTGRTNVNSSYSSLSSQEQNIASQILSVQKINEEFLLKRAGSTAEQIAAQEAQVDQTKASVLYYESQLRKTKTFAPFSGIITKVNFVRGDIVTSNAPVVSLIGSGKYEVEVNVAESDIAKIEVGKDATVILDAYGPDAVFTAKIAKINLSETVIDGVSTYKTTLIFNEDDKRILPGLTADITILSDVKENVLYVPTRNIISKNGKKVVKIVKTADGKEIIEEREINVGLRGSNGRTEILSGLSENDRIAAD